MRKYLVISKFYEDGSVKISKPQLIKTNFKKNEDKFEKEVDIFEDVFYGLVEANRYVKELKESL